MKFVDGLTYTCANNKDAPYIGLVNNKSSSAKDYPLIPCCFKTDQNRPGTKRTNFLKEPEVLPSGSLVPEESNIRIILTNDFLRPFQFGIIPVVETLAGPISSGYFRYGNTVKIPNVEGVDKTLLQNSTIIECVLNALSENPPPGIRPSVEYIREERDIYKRYGMIRHGRSYLGVCHGEIGLSENYDVDPKTLTLIRDDVTTNLCTRRFVAFVEEAYKVEVIVIGPSYRGYGTDTDIVVIPRRSYGKIPPKSTVYENVVVVYEHTGSRSSKKEELMCELVVRGVLDESGRRLSVSNWIFKQSDPFVKQLKSSFKTNTSSYTVPELPNGIKAQHINAAGKCVGLVFKNNVYASLPNQISPINYPRIDPMDLKNVMFSQSQTAVQTTQSKYPSLDYRLNTTSAAAAAATEYDKYIRLRRYMRRLFEVVYLGWCRWLLRNRGVTGTMQEFARNVLREVADTETTLPRLLTADNDTSQIRIPKGSTEGLLIDLRRRERIDAGFDREIVYKNATEIVERTTLQKWYNEIGDFDDDNVYSLHAANALLARQTYALVPDMGFYKAVFFNDVDNKIRGLIDQVFVAIPVSNFAEAADVTATYYGVNGIRDYIVVDCRGNMPVSTLYIIEGSNSQLEQIVVGIVRKNLIKVIIPYAAAP